jgi:2-polyprenyl-3-methyl-5-hydroxy-6-metoxy-1,4-benzoquinol methylase
MTTTTRSAALRHDALVAAYDAQRERVAGPQGDVWAALAPAFQADPKRPLDSLLTKIATFIRPDDVLIDVGGGAGRLSLPLAPRCKAVVVVDPSAGMHDGFDSILNSSRITNARFVEADWLDANACSGDVALVAHVTYFVPKIVPFIEKLNSEISRRAIVSVRSVPPPNQVAPFFELVHDEPYAPVPGHRELLAVLEELGIAAELIDVGPATASATAAVGKTHEDAVRNEVETAKKQGWLGGVPPERLADQIDQHFDELMVETDVGYLRRSVIDARDLLITWQTR